MRNILISFERKGVTSTSVETSSHVAWEIRLKVFNLKQYSQELGVINVRRIMMKTLVRLERAQENASLEKDMIPWLQP
jgi:hypothetical protein